MCKDHKVKINKNKFFNSNNIKLMLRIYSTCFRGIFRGHSNTYDGVFCKKLLAIFTKKESITDVQLGSISLHAVIGICILALKTISQQSDLVINILRRQSIHCD